MKTKFCPLVFCLVILLAGLVGCSSKPPEQVIVIPQGPTAYDKYKQEIGVLSQKAVTLREIPGDNGGEPYIIAIENTIPYNDAVRDLQARIKSDVGVEGSETVGKKAELLLALQQETSSRSPFMTAAEVNKKAARLVYQHYSNQCCGFV